MGSAKPMAVHEPQLDLWQRALESEKGIRVRTSDKASAIALRHKLYYARTAQARYHKSIYPADHALHGRSYYEGLIVRVDSEGVKIVKADDVMFEVEEL